MIEKKWLTEVEIQLLLETLREEAREEAEKRRETSVTAQEIQQSQQDWCQLMGWNTSSDMEWQPDYWDALSECFSIRYEDLRRLSPMDLDHLSNQYYGEVLPREFTIEEIQELADDNLLAEREIKELGFLGHLKRWGERIKQRKESQAKKPESPLLPKNKYR